MPVFANPLGLLTLLGIPVVLAIHFLQRKAREIPLSTLFLLERTQRDAASGRRFERLIPSVPLWLQLLAVLLLAWWLAEPRYPKSGSIQRVAVVMDSSASMSVFKERAIARLLEQLPALQGPAAELHLTVLESAPNRPRLYAGAAVADLPAALAAWQPNEGPLDPTQAIRLARSLVSRDGTVIYLTDTPPQAPLPFNARPLAVGEVLDNVGFTGMSFTTEQGTLLWRALVHNHGKQPTRRSWSLVTATGASASRALDLAPGAYVTLQATFPPNAQQVRVVLSGDRFPLDDVLPLVAPQPKPLRLWSAPGPALAELTAKLQRSLEAVDATTDAAAADLAVVTGSLPAAPAGNALVFAEAPSDQAAWLQGGIVAESHPLMDGLNWQSLLARETSPQEQRATDTVLLRQDQRPLILLRVQGNSRHLLFNFDLVHSNAIKQPAFIVLLHRFAESIRSAKVAPLAENLETGQALAITAAPAIPLTVEATDPDGRPLAHSDSTAAPKLPGFFTLRQGAQPLLTAAVHFGDPREADFSACGTADLELATAAATIERHTRPDPLWRLWLLGLMAALLASWKFVATRPAPAPVLSDR